MSNQVLVNKVYCPREVFPIAAIVEPAADALFALSALFVLFAVYTFAPHDQAFWVLPLLVVLVVVHAGGRMLLSILIVYLRDLRHLLPIVLQFGLFVTPVAYPLVEDPGRLAGPVLLPEPVGAVHRRLPPRGAARAGAAMAATSGWPPSAPRCC